MIELRPFTISDIGTLLAWIDSPAFLLQWAGPRFTYPLDEGQLRAHLAQMSVDEPALLAFKAVDIEQEQTIGHIELSAIDRRHRSATVARVLVGPERARGRGIGAQMTREVLRIGFEELALHRIQLSVFTFNAPAIACYEGLGFQKEGLVRDVCKHEDTFWSAYLMSMLEDEWAARRR
jgi:RimJ/RimL family protein N-acetyltransferase